MDTFRNGHPSAHPQNHGPASYCLIPPACPTPTGTFYFARIGTSHFAATFKTLSGLSSFFVVEWAYLHQAKQLAFSKSGTPRIQQNPSLEGVNRAFL